MYPPKLMVTKKKTKCNYPPTNITNENGMLIKHLLDIIRIC